MGNMEENEEYAGIMAEIAALKQLLSRADYMGMKLVDGAITEDDYAEVKAKKQQWRARINELEAQLPEEMKEEKAW